MIMVEGTGSNLKEICLTKQGKKVILTRESNPEELFSALSELALFVIRNRKVKT